MSNDLPLHANIPLPTSDGQRNKFSNNRVQTTSLITLTNNFFLRPPKSTYKTLFIGTELGELLQTMSSVKSVPEGLKLLECERRVGGKNSPIRYIPEKDPVQEVLKKTKKTNYF
jgi:hypothetical protein